MKALLIISLVLMVAFVALSCIFVGVPEKYSDWLKGWKEKLPKFPVNICAAVTVVALLLVLPSIFEKSSGSPWQFLGFIAAALAMFSVISTCDKKVARAVNAAVFAVVTFLWVALACGMWWLILPSVVVISLIACVTRTIDNNWLFWLDISAIGAAYVAMLF